MNILLRKNVWKCCGQNLASLILPTAFPHLFTPYLHSAGEVCSTLYRPTTILIYNYFTDYAGSYLKLAPNLSKDWGAPHFFRYAEGHKWCGAIAAAIEAPRLFAQEGLPLGPTWGEVQQLIASTAGDLVVDIRDHAILLLLAVYGLRRGEVARLHGKFILSNYNTIFIGVFLCHSKIIEHHA